MPNTKKVPVLKIVQPDDEHMILMLDDQEVAEVNHDQHGWAGMELAEKVARRLAELSGWKVT